MSPELDNFNGQNQQKINNTPLDEVTPINTDSTSQPNTVVSNSWLIGGKLIAVLFVVFVIISTGVYFAFFSKPPSTRQSTENLIESQDQKNNQTNQPKDSEQKQLMQAEQNKANNQTTNGSTIKGQSNPTIHCQDLLSKQDYQKIWGTSSAVLTEKDQSDQGFQGFSLDCFYNDKTNLSFTVSNEIGAAWSIMYSQRSQSYNDSVDLTGIGNSSYGSESVGQIHTLSTNKKYDIIISSYFERSYKYQTENFKKLQALTKIINSNLNNY